MTTIQQIEATHEDGYLRVSIGHRTETVAFDTIDGDIQINMTDFARIRLAEDVSLSRDDEESLLCYLESTARNGRERGD